ncbi:MAG: VaFE repeat-containing surface-anchored protein [Eggerthellaceae bacterium]|nr:VaFE repeat-containing surface-anchored protein [Eggerthellaceae bacterium]
MQVAKTSKRIARLALAALMVVAAALALPGRAHADDLDGVPRTITGTCYIGETWMVGDQSFFAIPSFSGGLSGAVPSTTFECLDHTAAAPEYTDADYTAELCDYSVSEGWVEYYVTIIPPDVTDGYTSNEYGLIGYQRVGGKVRIPHEFNGELNLAKSSARPSVTDGNPCYSLEGAVYEVFSSRGADGSLSGKVGELTTDASGHTNTLTLSAGVYFVKEKTPPVGYLASGETHQTTVPAGATATVEASDQPGNDPAGVLVQKVDAVTGKNVPVGDASLAGAEITFRYYAGYYGGEGQPALPANADRTWVMKTDSNGYANINYGSDYVVSGDEFFTNSSGNKILPLGTITAIETKAPTGYLLGEPTLFITQFQYDSDALTGANRVKVNYVGVATQGNAADTAQIQEQPQRGNIELVKRDPETADGSAQGDATLAGAVFDIVNESANPVVSPQTGAEVANGGVVCQIVTDAEGFASTTRADLNGWSIPDGWDGKALDFGTYTVRESRAPEGYDLNAEWGETAVIDSDGKTVSFSLTDDVIRGGVAIGKIDRGNEGYLPEGAATLAGATFSVYNIGGADVVVDGVQYAPGKVVATIVTVEDNGRYIASTSIDALPYSSYELRESGTSAGYLFDYDSRTWRKQFQVRAHEIVDLTDESDAVANQVIRGDIFFNKVHEFTMARLPGVPFKVTSKTTGEWHVIVTDENGQVSTAADWNSHLTKTNANDSALGPDGKVDESKLDSRAGVWFHGRTDAESAISDDLGAMPFDTYVISELQCEANKGFTPVEFEVTISRDGRELDLGTVDDHEAPSLGTELTGPDGIHVVPVNEDAVLVDAVSFKALPLGGYTMEGELHLVEPDGSDGGVVATASKDFVASTSSGTVEMVFRVDSSNLGGSSLVAFERAISDDGTVVASHEDLSDEGQTVTIPVIGTTLTDAADGDHEAASTGPVTLVDTVSYEGLQPDKAYTMSAVLHLKGDGGEDLGVAKDANGDAITSQQQFTPTEPSGTVEVTFTFAPDQSMGATVVAFEELRCGERAYAAHAEISDEAQSADIPWIGTTASDSKTGSHTAHLGDSVSIVDVVAYEKLQAGVEYELAGILHSRDADGRDLGVVSDKDGKPVTAAAKFTPESSSGTVELAFEAEADSAPGATFVVFETLTRSGEPVAEHSDISDEGQTVHFPEIGTTATDTENGTHTSANDRTVEISDEVAYSNLVPGEEYTVSGTLHLKGADGSDAGELKGTEGKPVTAEKTFVPDKPSGSVALSFEVDGSLLAGKTAVAFESVYVEGVEVAAHADITDEGQSVHFPAALQTTSVSTDTATQTMPLGEKAEIVDTVAYWNLVPGETYELSGTVHVRGADGTDQGALEQGGAAASSSARFMPETPDGLVEVRFEVDTTGLAGSALVVFEDLSSEDGSHIASHADISDGGQTVKVPSIGTTATDKASRNHGGVASASVTIVDEIAYEGLEPGHSYRAEGALYDKGTGEPYLVKGKAVTAMAEFTAEGSSGTASVAFDFDGSALAGAQLVAFERVYDAGGSLVAVHEDIDDEGQTVSYRSPDSSIVTKVTQDAVKFYDRTADWLLGHWPALLAALALIGSGAFLLVRRRGHEGKSGETPPAE